MKRFYCHCPDQAEIFFESTTCLGCDRLIGFNDVLGIVTSFDRTSKPDEYFCEADGEVYRQCENYLQYGVCNGMVGRVPDDTVPSPELCFGCHFNNTVPDTNAENTIPLWRKLEAAKRRTLFTLTNLGLPLQDRAQQPEWGLQFDFIADRNSADHFESPLVDQEPVFTGHNQGVVTINLAEADDVARTNMKADMNERYRTLLGHFRHEIGHFFWDRLVQPDKHALSQYRILFGDERADYQTALKAHYSDGPSANWQQDFITPYAASHPWEDWAETWAHYLHMIDTLETAKSFDVQLSVTTPSAAEGDVKLPQEEGTGSEMLYAKQTDIGVILGAWVKLSVTLNALNRSMGLEDAYPFVLTAKIREKLAFVHNVVHFS